MKKKQFKSREPTKLNHLMKNFQNVESYINIMDIIQNLSLTTNQESQKSIDEPKVSIKEIVPKTIQMKIKDKLGPILNQKYEEESARRN